MQSVSDPNLSKPHISPTRHTFRLKPSKIVGRPKHGMMSRANLQPNDTNDESSKSDSPYYNGLTDQSLAILDDVASCPAPHTPFFSSGHSPYYNGLTDYSLVIDSWSHPATATNSLTYESSPYYRGLTDYSLVLNAPHPHSSDSHSPMLSINMKGGEEIMEKFTAATPGQMPDFTLKELMTKMVDDDGFVIEEKPMRESVSEESKDGSALEEIAQKTTLEMMTKRVDVRLVVEEKALTLREKESEASKVGIELEENAEKTISEEMELMTKGGGTDDFELAIEEKALKETMSEASKVESIIVEENTELMTNEVDDDVRLVIEEKPLRERVSEGSNVEMSVPEETILEEMNVGKEEQLKDYGLSDEKKKPLSVSQKTVASELEDVTQEKLKDTIEEGNVYEYIWATKYQPMTLADFICNRDKALELKELVRIIDYYTAFMNTMEIVSVTSAKIGTKTQLAYFCRNFFNT